MAVEFDNGMKEGLLLEPGVTDAIVLGTSSSDFEPNLESLLRSMLVLLLQVGELLFCRF